MMKRIQGFLFALLLIFSALSFSGCGGDDDRGGGINLFSIEDDKMLGMQLRDEILANPQEYPILDEGQYP
ncbi:MAG: hypothetical protein HRU12_11665, partial [Phaeodactylibacter sp.]|nr:hypothetical protein [Phaeodactylibacter sp.]